ncbi:GARP complex subunit Vps53 [Schizosaccharomyces japonicus yFS275]|uniref:GARP complex subunit Vps53 n=1 Tax=Schizosaccharomyces japonicus (strain yFS275 / FY16936) TaxID=402676 RepID=B6K826_SCHJY|nr:GARP complex subunit Vps53 [Schizosaccharomyces japonicus yFS275]EEB09680.1 GARP complex subunit Vps53 [Schizosaccharomyces japonicus yFS275]
MVEKVLNYDALRNEHFDALEELEKLIPKDASSPSSDGVSETRTLLQDCLRIVSEDTAHENEVYEQVKQKQKQEDLAIKQGVQNLLMELKQLFMFANDTQTSIVQMTSEIKSLDMAKTNITSSMTLLKRLQMLVTAFEKLRYFRQTRNIGDSVGMMQVVLQLLQYFKQYRSVDQIAALTQCIVNFKTSYDLQIREMFELLFKKNESLPDRSSASTIKNMKDACKLFDVLGEESIKAITDWYCKHQLSDFLRLFQENEEANALENLSRRYTWFAKLLTTYDTSHKDIFPENWRVDYHLCMCFCDSTKSNLKMLLSQKKDSLKYDVFVGALQHTVAFEDSLKNRFGRRQTSERSRLSLDSTMSIDLSNGVFDGIISEVFEPYVDIYFAQQELLLKSILTKAQSSNAHDESLLVLPSSTDLFRAYRGILAQFVRFSRSEALLSLAKLFASWLSKYIRNVLLLNSLTVPIRELAVRINTSDYICVTTLQLEDKFKKICVSELQDQVSFKRVVDEVNECVSKLLKEITIRFERAFEQSFQAISKINWKQLETVGDQSPYIGTTIETIDQLADQVLPLLEQTRYVRNVSDRVSDVFVAKFLGSLTRVKQIPEVAAEQLLLDAYSIKKFLLTLPSKKPDYQPTEAYVRYVSNVCRYVEIFLKTLLTPAHPTEGLVDSYLFLVGDRSISNFSTILEFKGIGKSEQAGYLSCFSKKVSGNESLQDSLPLFQYLEQNSFAAKAKTSFELTPEHTRKFRDLGRLFVSKRRTAS